MQAIDRLERITAALADAISAEEVAEAIVDEAAHATGAVTGGLWVLEQQSLRLVRSIGFPAEATPKFAVLPLQGGLHTPVAEAIQTGRPVWLVTDEAFAAYPGLSGVPLPLTGGPIAALPLVARGKALGALSFRFPPGQPLGEEQRPLLLLIGRLAAQALDKALLYESALKADRRKDEFLAMLGHELRNPLAPILTALQLMRLRGAQTFDKERHIIERQIQNLVRLVDDLLDVSRITGGRINLKKHRVEMGQVIADAVETASPLFEARSQRLRVEVPPMPLMVEGDEARLAQAIGNLLNNAAKYSETGSEIRVSAAQERGEVVVRVRDSGVGIAPEVLPLLFDRFVQEARSLDRSEGGLGLGLTIVRSLVEMHGGRVSARSEGPGKGSEFEIRLPWLDADLDEENLVTPLPMPRAVKQPARVLIVDDNVDAAEVLADGLRAVGYVAETAHDGPSGLIAARKFQPKVALLDIGLPVMDGYELAARMRADAELGAVRLVAITGYGQEGDKTRAKEAGFDEHLVKPVDLDRVVDVIARLTS